MTRRYSAALNLVTLVVAALLVSGCSVVYKLPIYQGNYIDQKKVDQLEVGMRPEQVRFLLGTSLVDDVSQDTRWDYVAFYRSPRGKRSRRVLTLYFEDGLVSRIEGKENPYETPSVEDRNEDVINSDDKLRRNRDAEVQKPASEQKTRLPGDGT